MKTTFPQRNRRQSPFRNQILIIFSALLLGGLILSFTSGFFITVFSPLWRGQNAFARGTGVVIGFFKTKSSLIQENEALQERIKNDEDLITSARAVVASRDALLASFGRSVPRAEIAASVLVHPPKTPYDTLIIDAGEKDGVRAGMTVSLPEGPDIGTVSSVESVTSKVFLFSSNSLETQAILERNNIPINLIGDGGGNFHFELARDAAVVPGDKILSLSTRGALIAVVGDIESSPTDSFKKVLAKNTANIYSLHFVSIKP